MLAASRLLLVCFNNSSLERAEVGGAASERVVWLLGYALRIVGASILYGWFRVQ